MRTPHFLLGAALVVGLAAPAFAEEAELPLAEATEAPVPEAAAPAEEPSAAVVPLGPVGYDASGQEGRIHVVVPGDTLWDISEAYLGTPWVWPSVWTANEAIENPHLILPDDRIWISATEMRRVTADEAEALLAGTPAFEPLPEAPAAFDDSALIQDGLGSGASYRYTEINTAGFVTADALSGAATIVGADENRTWFADADLVQVGLGAGEVSPGDQLEIFRPGDAVLHPETGLPYGFATETIGWMRVEEVHAESATAKILQSRGEIGRGDHVLPRVVRPVDIPVLGPPTVDGTVIHLPSERSQMASTDIVYLDRGVQHGVQVGSPLEIYRSRGTGFDEVRGMDRALPDEVVAKMIVIDAHPNAAVAVITHTEGEIERGDRFRGSDSLR